MKKLRAGVIGVGYLGTFHAQKYAALDHVDLVGIVDADLDRARKLAAELGTQAFGDHRELLGKVDAVSVVVPTLHHFDVSMDFLENDVDLLIEKPITITLEEADRLIECADARGRIIQVGLLERFNPPVVALEKIVTTPRFIEADRLSVFKPRGIDVSVVLDLMIHDIDIISSLVKSDIKQIHAAGTPIVTDQVDIANARIEFENGCVANITASRVSMKNERKLRIFQPDAYYSVDFANHELTVMKRSDTAEQDLIPGTDVKQNSFSRADALNEEIKAFVDAVTNRTQPKVNGKVGRDALAIALQVMGQINTANRRESK
jgi:predicted dehydrogenase